tara:strand:- start:276 stop:605 length:330 start_codon:yes stop_codon:yes gene_type:complete
MTTATRIATALTREIRRINADLMDCIAEPSDSYWDRYGHPLADVFVRASDDGLRVTVCYDGAGYDYLSPCADYPTVSDKYRARLDAVLRAIDPTLYLEDNNSWSASVWL